MEDKVMQIENPLILVYEDEGKIMTLLHSNDRSYKEYGILIADIVRHVANAFKVHENDVWDWVDKERDHQTSPIIEMKPN